MELVSGGVRYAPRCLLQGGLDVGKEQNAVTKDNRRVHLLQKIMIQLLEGHNGIYFVRLQPLTHSLILEPWEAIHPLHYLALVQMDWEWRGLFPGGLVMSCSDWWLLACDGMRSCILLFGFSTPDDV